MPRLTVDDRLCTRCGQCRAICPLRVITIPDDSWPRYVDQGADRCIICGHCEALCPTGAIEVNDPRLDPVRHAACTPELDRNLLADYLRMRRSIRSFRPEAVAPPLIAELLDVVRYAPTGSNSQCVEWLVIHDTAEVRRLTGLVVDWMRAAQKEGSPLNDYFNFAAMIRACEQGKDPICRHAPHLLIAHAASSAVTAATDAHIALAHLDILAPAFGLGTCWGGFFQMATEQWAPLREALALGEGQIPHYAMMLGIPALRFRRPPKRKALTVAWR